jgi:hypothetical protein
MTKEKTDPLAYPKSLIEMSEEKEAERKAAEKQAFDADNKEAELHDRYLCYPYSKQARDYWERKGE